MENIEKSAKNICKTTLETRAYLCALSESKGLNLAKHMDQVEREMEEADKSNGDFKI